MPQSSTIIHILQVISALLCIHAVYPKGVTYGEPDDWEVKAKARREANKQEQRRRVRKERERARKEYDDYEFRRSEKSQKRIGNGDRNGEGQKRLRYVDEVRYIER